MVMYIDTKGDIQLTFKVNVIDNGNLCRRWKFVLIDENGYFVGYLPESITEKELKRNGFRYESENLIFRT